MIRQWRPPPSRPTTSATRASTQIQAPSSSHRMPLAKRATSEMPSASQLTTAGADPLAATVRHPTLAAGPLLPWLLACRKAVRADSRQLNSTNRTNASKSLRNPRSCAADERPRNSCAALGPRIMSIVANFLYVDNSNVWIEGMHVSAVAKGMAPDIWTAQQERICDYSWKIDFGRLHDFAGGTTDVG